MKKTTITNWFLVDLINLKEKSLPQLLGQILWGDVLSDDTGRFKPGDYVCSNLIVARTDRNFITKSGSHYECVGKEKHVEVNIFDLHIIRQGVSPKQLIDLKQPLKLDLGRPDPAIDTDTLFKEIKEDSKLGKFKFDD
ncbi:hypothetical protein Q4575_15325 [Psychrosphaera sp. 1_MG-2023]|uniref:hypothetical protein n=1 Tax=Psychrosphaera sp. 1_MG-2023 TaxID=3062643 RepID=UPI0026E2572A|nr:hypothetical protein [Psychrosphaera sp. 1_MG-2023]MDO6720784.1 hypothetical protein [Psychrosphaera sp. 1_MG-2023]